MLKWITVKDYGSVSLGSSTQVQSDVTPRVLGGVVGFQFVFTVGLTGTPTSPADIEAAVNQIRVTDVNRNNVFQINGLDVPYLAYNNSPFGVFTTPTVASASSATDEFTLMWPVRVQDQPLTITTTIDTLSTVSGGGSTAGTVDFVINMIYDDAVDPASTLRMTNNDNSLASGTNNLSNKLGQDLTTIHVALRNTANSDSNFTSVQLEGGGSIQIESMTVDGFKAYEAIKSVSGHQAGYYPIPLSQPFVTTSSSLLNVVAGGSITVRLYQFYI